MPNNTTQRYLRHGTLTQLRVFEAVVRNGSFTRAAREVHLAQPTVSVNIKKLTDIVGLPLLQQIGKRVEATAAGAEVYEASQRIFETLGQLDEALADIRGLKCGTLRVATTTSGRCLLPQLLAAFLKEHPGIEVVLCEGSRQAVLERLASKADDLYLFANPPEGEHIVSHAILTNPLIAYAPRAHPLAGVKKISFARFAREPMLMREPGSGTRLAVERVFGAHGIPPRVSMELGSNETIREAIIAGAGVSLLYRYSLGLAVDRKLAVLDVEGLPTDGQWYLTHANCRQLSSVAHTFIAFARRETQRIVKERMRKRPAKGEDGVHAADPLQGTTALRPMSAPVQQPSRNEA